MKASGSVRSSQISPLKPMPSRPFMARESRHTAISLTGFLSTVPLSPWSLRPGVLLLEHCWTQGMVASNSRGTATWERSPFQYVPAFALHFMPSCPWTPVSWFVFFIYNRKFYHNAGDREKWSHLLHRLFQINSFIIKTVSLETRSMKGEPGSPREPTP